MKRFALVFLFLFTLVVSTAKAYELEWSCEDQAIVLTQSISVREGPSTGDHKVTTEHADSVLEITEELEKWYKVITPDGNEGYVRRRYVTANFGYIHFSESELPQIRCMPFDVSPMLLEPEDARGKTYLVIGEYGNWLKLKIDKATGFVRKYNTDCMQYREEDCYTSQALVVTKNAKVRAEPSNYGTVITTLDQGSTIDVCGVVQGFYKVYVNGMYGYIPCDRLTKYFSKIIAYGTVYLKTDPDTNIDTDGAAVGEWSKKVYTVIGKWQDYWVVLYGEGSALIKDDSLIFTGEEIDYYYSQEPTYGTVTDWDTKLYGRGGRNDFGNLDLGATVAVVGQDGDYYIVKCKFKDEKCIAWVEKNKVFVEAAQSQ